MQIGQFASIPRKVREKQEVFVLQSSSSIIFNPYMPCICMRMKAEPISYILKDLEKLYINSKNLHIPMRSDKIEHSIFEIRHFSQVEKQFFQHSFSLLFAVFPFQLHPSRIYLKISLHTSVCITNNFCKKEIKDSGR